MFVKVDTLEVFSELEVGGEHLIPLSRFDGLPPVDRALMVSHIGQELRDRGYSFDLDPVRNVFVIKRMA